MQQQQQMTSDSMAQALLGPRQLAEVWAAAFKHSWVVL
jgi:hypothetical protein